MAKKNIEIPKDNNIIRMPLEEVMPDNYLPYAVEVAKDRALPDVRDGLKPVHRRILYGAYMLKAFPDKPYYKSARIVGDILGKYHPHGDSSVYDAMVILAQNFSTRAPLIDGHGNWGSIDGDGAAAMRYTEARLSSISMEMLRDIEKNVVDMVPNYSDSEMEPKVLPARYPNLLVNGTFGIAVGLSTNIPPHNLREVIDGTLAYIDNNEITTRELMNYIKGPDLPTGGVLIGEKTLLSAYETGEGKVTLRAKAKIETLENGRLGIVITEFPYRRNKARILQTISDMTGDKRHAKALDGIVDIRDESDRTGIRAVIEFKKAVDHDMADKVLKYLYKKTDLQGNISFNMVALADGKPETMGLKTIISHYVNHQKDVVTRRTKRELEVAEKRFHIVEGFIKAIGIMDEVIATIRASKSKKDAHENLVSKFGFTDLQAEAILELMLYRLTGLEIKVFQKEHKELSKKIKALRKILENESVLLGVIKDELKEVAEVYGDERRTALIEDESEAKIDLEELIVAEDVMVTLSNEGFIKKLPLKTYNRSNVDENEIEYREGDYLKFLIKSNTKDTLAIFTDKGTVYQIKCNSVADKKWKDKGERLEDLIRGLSLEDEKIIALESIENFLPNKCFKFITANGLIKKTTLDKFVTAYSKLMAIKLKNDDLLASVSLIDSQDEERFVEIETTNGLNFVVSEPELEFTDRNILGVQLVPLKSGNQIKSIRFVDNYEYKEFIIGINKKGNIKTFSNMNSNSYEKVKVNSFRNIIAFSNKGKVFKFPAYLLQNTEESNISDLVDGFEKDEIIIKVAPINEFGKIGEDLFVYFFSREGLVKKTSLREFLGEFNNQIAYKFKTPKDELVNVDINFENATVILVTKNGMGIKFLATAINPMGRVASGVTGISLKDDNKVIFGKVIPPSEDIDDKTLEAYNDYKKELTSNYEKLILESKQKEKAEVNIEDIKLQNRAGRGSSLMILVLEDYIRDVIIK
ncbi:DNA topoisomerase IV subunit A [Clostridium perfringens]|uniref:DNA topoisomerase (ATP-hydrolyzing) n=1 Tax=Clostridium perfringens (strain ATCC 13124 / DSM 756 / JCM 1290 / NCIMB 6125 / NCTC 8237 / Type A) TaxID=195103 RepID=A0A0H2YRF7_CLOP1|nr:DNA topoisomerase IV subunit A [Clostridium perfringens]ABG83503.1 DNA gyrase/topoisomerase IV, A subunit family protein [Clostridium perfringens ATCC 13124]AMN33564.1 DNA topoisomerase IV subunit A [Clostridium perfringens]EDT27674.1 DNA topoisomerase, GyrA/ParC subunit family [Clostridium perfringens CPE str. F4969]EGT0680204.1 DNA topoisomerase IV subunit A [Clostridium perfringens]EGT0684555.1 DNA topoisomerase IV subunit A [Clostridium perfringens]